MLSFDSVRALEIHDVARATPCMACALEMRSSNGREILNLNYLLLTLNVTPYGTVIKDPKTETAILFLNLTVLAQWWLPRVLVHFQPCCTLPT